jgi:hypothetical protein
MMGLSPVGEIRPRKSDHGRGRSSPLLPFMDRLALHENIAAVWFVCNSVRDRTDAQDRL